MAPITVSVTFQHFEDTVISTKGKESRLKGLSINGYRDTIELTAISHKTGAPIDAGIDFLNPDDAISLGKALIEVGEKLNAENNGRTFALGDRIEGEDTWED